MQAATRISLAAGRRASIACGIFIYLVVLYLSYVHIISPGFSYMGYVHSEPPWGAVALGALAAWLPSLWMPVRLQRPSQLLYWLLYVLTYVPSCLIPILSLTRPVVETLGLTAVLLLCFALLGAGYGLPLLRLPRLSLGRRTYWTGFALLTGLLFAAVVATFGFRFEWVGLFEVYDVRADYADTQAHVLVRYGVTWLGNVLFPLLLIVGLLTRSPLPLLAGAAGQFYIFSSTGFKSVLFSGLLILATYIALTRRGRHFGSLVAWGVTGLVSLSVLLDLAFRTYVVSSMFVRRLIVTPGILSGWYFDFFNDRPHAQLGHSILEGLVGYPYDRTPARLIGLLYFGREQTSANANVWADAFANFGYGGMLLFTAVLMLVFWLFDSLMAGRSFKQLALVTMALTGPAISLVNTGIIQTLVIHGLALLWLLLLLLPPSALRERRPRGVRVGSQPLPDPP